MKLSFKGAHGLSIKSDNPDEYITAEILRRMTKALIDEQKSFLQEVQIALRTLKPGQKRVLLSKPIRIELEQSTDTSPVAQEEAR